MPIIEMKAIAFVIHCNHTGKDALPNNNFVINKVIDVSSKLETDDVGYVYDPAEHPPEVCIIAGQMVGKVANLKLPYGMNLGNAVDITITTMLSIDDDYTKLVHVITDSYKDSDSLWLKYAFRRAEKLVTIKIYGVGRHYDCKSLRDLCNQFNLQFVHCDEAQAFSLRFSQCSEPEPQAVNPEPEPQKSEAHQEEIAKTEVASDVVVD